MLIQNPCDAVELPRTERREMNAFSPEEAASFLKSAKDNEQGVIFALATGMRPEEGTTGECEIASAVENTHISLA